MQLTCQKDKFSLPDAVSYLNCAYMAPIPNCGQKAAREMLDRLSRPYLVTNRDFFDPADQLRKAFSRLIHCEDPERIAITPSVSYGLANAVKQIRPVRGSRIVLAEGEYPSGIYAWLRYCKDYECELVMIPPPGHGRSRSLRWNQSILDAIDQRTAAVLIAPLHWSDGSRFDLEAIRDKSRQYNALMMVDGSQAFGALPFDLRKVNADVLLTTGYKWLLGPYGTALAYYSDYFDEGIPIEENWITHRGSRSFKDLVNHNPELLEKGRRYSAGQHPAFLHLAMLNASLEQLLEWSPDNIQEYCRSLINVLESRMPSIREMMVDAGQSPAHHLFGIRFPDTIDLDVLKQQLDARQIYVSVRGDVMRVSLHLYNDQEDMVKLADCILGSLG